MSEPQVESAQSLWRAVPALPSIYGFIITNTLTFQIALATPLVLMARHWGGSQLYIGLLTALVPLLSLLQIYMAPRLEHIGFRRVMLMGWAGRNATLFLTAALPFMGGLMSNSLRLTALFCFMFGFNFLRGLATASWLPWISHLVPTPLRGRYLSTDQLTSNLSSAVTFFMCGYVLGDHATDARFGILFIIALSAGWGSLYFLKSIDSPPPKPGKPLIEPFRTWARRVWADCSFRRLIRVNVLISLALAAWDPFTTVFMRDRLMVPDRLILYITSVKMVVASLGSAWLWGLLSDRFGSRPVMALATRLIMLVILCWLLIALGIFPSSVKVLGGLAILLQGATIGFVVSNTRYLMNNAPKAFPVLALTLFGVMTGVANAIAPIIWGAVLDLLHGIDRLHLHLGPLSLNSYAFFFAGMVWTMVATKMLIRRLPDRDASSTNTVMRHLLTDYPLRPFSALYRAVFGRSEA